MPTLNESISNIESKASTLTPANIEALFGFIENRAKDLKGFSAPWTPQAKRADLKLAAWLKAHKKPATYAEIAAGLAEQYDGVTADMVKQIVDTDQAIEEVKYRKFTVDGDKVDVRVKGVKKATVQFVKRA